MSGGATCSVNSSTSTTAPRRDRIGVSDPHGRARDLSPLPGYWPQTWTSLSQGHDGGVLGLLSAVAGVLVRGDAERLQVRMRQTPPVARCASHPPKLSLIHI